MRSPTYDEDKNFYASKPPIDVLFELRSNAEFNQVVLRRIQGKYVWFFHRPQRRSMTPHTIETPVLRAENKQDHQRKGNSEKSFSKVLAMIYDLMGWLQPIVVKFKIFFQQVYKEVEKWLSCCNILWC